MKTTNCKKILEAIDENFVEEQKLQTGLFCRDFLVRGDTTYVVTYGAGELPAVWTADGSCLFDEGNRRAFEEFLKEL